MPVYSDKVNERAVDPPFAGSIAEPNAVGVSASFTCGSFVRFYLKIDADGLVISEVAFHSDGCGYAVAAASAIAESVAGVCLADLHGLDEARDLSLPGHDLGEFPPERGQCSEMALAALRSALARFREKRVEEFAGEKALICSCFGVAEEAIEKAINEGELRTVGEVAAATNAGSGCGSCRMLIQELLDTVPADR